MPRQLTTQRCPYCGRVIRGPAYYRHVANHERDQAPPRRTSADRAATDGSSPNRTQVETLLDEWEALKAENQLLRAKLEGIKDILDISGRR
jgi:hypothetical protein